MSGYGRTWWGRAWVEALTERARLDPNRLMRGRAYARSGRVSDLDILPGTIIALVEGSRPDPYTVTIHLPVFDEPAWVRRYEEIGHQVGHLAALLAGDLPPLDLLPAAGELRTTCSCPDQVEPCKHAAAVCYLTADILDADPFTLMLLRGRSRHEVLDALRKLRQPAWSTPAGMLAREAFSRRLAPLPTPALPPAQPGPPAPLPAHPPDAAGISPAALAESAARAARRAWDLLST
jgi:uncharacterized Zn finger protein